MRGIAVRTCLLLLLLLANVAMAAIAAVDLSAPQEYRVKAVFLFNFTQFVSWPAEAFADPKAPLVIGVLGDDPFGTYLDETVRDENVDNRTLLVRRYRRVEDIDACQVLFISQSEAPQLAQIIASLKGRSILTVSDADGFARKGGIVRFIMENHRVRLRINLDEARAAGLLISSKLLNVSEITKSDTE